MGDYHKVIGIDLGTTFSVVSTYSLSKGEVVVIPSPQNQRTTPSVVYIAKNGQIVVGDGARRRLERDPGGVVIEAKRMMGERDAGGGKHLIKAAGKEFEPEFISAAILKELKGYAERFIGEPVHDAVITVPAYFKEPQKKATEDAARLARLNPRLLVNEPTAAAVAYGLNEEEDLTYVVYDFGGGTFDVSVVRVRNGRQFDILGTGGDAKLGGGDIDQILIVWMLANMRAEHGRDFSGDARLVGKIRLEAERVKIALCNADAEQEFEIDQPTPDIDRVSYFIGPAEFKKRIRPLLERTRLQVDVAMESAAKKAGIGWDDVDAFILVGGSSKIPYARQMLAEAFGKPIKADLNPDEIVSIGAARLALDYQPSQFHEPDEDKPLTIDSAAAIPLEGVVDTQIKDVVSHTLGIGLKDDKYDPLIEKDKYIPHRIHRKNYTTAEDNQTSIYIPVFQGDNPKASLNYRIGEVVISDLAPAPVGTHHFEVIFALDANGIFNGELIHSETGATKPIKLQRGEDLLVEKRRMELADLLDQGNVTGPADANGPGTPSDPIATLIDRAQAALNALPASAQGEMNAALAQLILAQHGKNAQAQGQAVLKIRSLLDTHQAS